MIKHKKIINSLRWATFIIIGLIMAFNWLNAMVGLAITFIFALIDETIVIPKLKSVSEKRN